MFKALMIEKIDDQHTVSLKELDDDQLPQREVTVEVDYSTLNYKDYLAISNALPIVREYPLVPGIDFAGTVVETKSADYAVGQKVVLNGWGVGEQYWGGLSQRASVNADWLVPLPSVFDTRQAMAIGTAGYTSMLCVLALEKHGITPDKGQIVVTGASGGVGSVAIVLLSKLGYDVVAVTGRTQERPFLESLGAKEIIDRETLSKPGKPLQKERWAGAVDTVGSVTLANICAGLKYDGVVAACGLAGGMDVTGTVMPFILRSVTLAGVDSVLCPRERRIEAWNRLATDLDIEKLNDLTSEIGLSDVIETSPKFMEGKVRGRLIVDVAR